MLGKTMNKEKKKIMDIINRNKRDVLPYRSPKFYCPEIHHSRSLRRLKRRYVSAFKFKFNISMHNIKMTDDVLTFIKIHNKNIKCPKCNKFHNGIYIKKTGESLVFAKCKTNKNKNYQTDKMSGNI
jgi:hypothetical protein